MDVINENEAQFLSSLRQGRRVIDRTLRRVAGARLFPGASRPLTRPSCCALHYSNPRLPSGSIAWSLHRNLGFPLDLISLMVEEKGVAMDTETLRRLAMEEEKVSLSLLSRPSQAVMATATQ